MEEAVSPQASLKLTFLSGRLQIAPFLTSQGLELMLAGMTPELLFLGDSRFSISKDIFFILMASLVQLFAYQVYCYSHLDSDTDFVIMQL